MLRARIAAEEGNLPLARTLLAEQIRLTPNHSGLREQRAMVFTSTGSRERSQGQRSPEEAQRRVDDAVAEILRDFPPGG